ncbi:hypothetical protein [Streptomyces canus]|uniref:Uncharacterized protein n=1 Tax=Streptomyces canus TaxID=58343 RepID=A0AAW8FR77_9ACTN|nr:hypothetical protein [Streptomyces canus]MDQ0911575.1 hypothetical protein [Streptomyces canus]
MLAGVQQRHPDSDGDHGHRDNRGGRDPVGTAAAPDGEHPLGEPRCRRGLFGGLLAQSVAHDVVDVHGRTPTGE